MSHAAPPEIIMAEVLTPPIDYKRVQTLDPFDANREFALLPAINRDRDVTALASLCVGMVAQMQKSLAGAPVSPEVGVAQIRDLDTVGSSLQALGHDPEGYASGYREASLATAEIFGGSPRATVYSYSVGNSVNQDLAAARNLGLQRSYSGSHFETELFIPTLSITARACREMESTLAEVRPRNSEAGERTSDEVLAAIMEHVAEKMAVLAEHTALLIQQTDIEEFNKVIAPWFPTIDFGTPDNPNLVEGATGSLVAGPTDRMMWGARLLSDDDPEIGPADKFTEYPAYAAHFDPYMDGHTRSKFQAFIAASGGKGILSDIYERCGQDPDSPLYRATAQFLAAQRQFRNPHTRTVLKALDGESRPGDSEEGNESKVITTKLLRETLLWSEKFGYKRRGSVTKPHDSKPHTRTIDRN